MLTGETLGPYRVLEKLGEGGMGEVYRAKDTKLGREVALKVLPDLFAHDPERRARFEREAQVLASLNHPNIAHIHGLEDVPAGQAGQAAVRALVLELVEGPTLADRIAKGPVPLVEALAIASQIADALDAAHAGGVIHRDLKPANVKIKNDGTVKVLDFGLAKALDPVSPSSLDPMNSPTLSVRATQMGVILGTAAYMSPEQAKGKTADQRSDIWAFGVVLFEMLSGKPLFAGETASETIASVLKEEPDWTQLPPGVPSPIRRLLRRCLEKDPKKRLSAIADARLELNELTEEDAPGLREQATASLTAVRRVRPSAAWLIGTGLIGAIVATAVWLWVGPGLRSTPYVPLTRASVLGPDGVALAFDSSQSAISPDGRHIAFTTVDPNGTTRLWVRALSALTAQPLAGTENANLPFWSPDSLQVGFFADGKMKKVPAQGGTVEVLCDAKDGRGGSWSSANIIVFSPSNGGALQRVSANGGEPTAATTLDTSKREAGHRFPWFLPDGRHFLFAALPARDGKFDLYVGSLDSSARQAVTSAESAAAYADPGYLLFARRNLLVAQRFDPRTFQISGEPVTIGDAPSALGALYAASRAVSVSTTGTLAYLGDRLPDTTLTWLDRSGRPVGTVAVPHARYGDVALSPDGRRAAIVRAPNATENDIWIADLERGGATRFTFGPASNYDPVWSPDGDRVAFASERNGPRDVFIKSSNGATPEEALFKSTMMFKDPRSWSADGKFIVFDQNDPQTNRDLWLLPVDPAAGDRAPKPYLRTPFQEYSGVVSPDGRWMAYVSDESGRLELYVDAFPTPRSKYRVTNEGLGLAAGAGVRMAFWRKDGRELIVGNVDGRSLVAADVLPGPEFRAGPAHQLLTLPKGTVAVDPAADFSRFLVAVPVNESTTSSLTLVFDWRSVLGTR